jgi:hypothetical protein
VAADYDDPSGTRGKSGFARGTPGRADRPAVAVIRHLASAPDIGNADASKLQLYIYHDEDAEVYINGVLAATCVDFNGQYDTTPISDEARLTLRPTGNSLAIHCRQTRGGQYIDAGVVTVNELSP